MACFLCLFVLLSGSIMIIMFLKLFLQSDDKSASQTVFNKILLICRSVDCKHKTGV